MKRRTKIVCTLGPASSSADQIEKMIDAGMNVARLNCSHGDWETKAEWIHHIRALSPDVSPVAILADLQGPKFRIADIAGGRVEVEKGQSVTIGLEPSDQFRLLDEVIFEAMEPNARLLLGDGDVELKLGPKTGHSFEAKVQTSGIIKSRQGVTLVGKHFDVPAMTEKDRQDVYEACKLGVDFMALSYVRRANDMRELRKLVDQYDPSVRLCAKIETSHAIKELDEILKVSDVIMVARGDLGLQMDLEDVPIMQKEIIAKCNAAGKPVITATQMLESMMINARPTRAEATDIANAILDGSDAIMLSGETASGAYPILSVKYMSRIAEKAETQFDHDRRLTSFNKTLIGSALTTEAVAQAAVRLATILKAKAILTTSTTGLTPRMVSKFRPKCPILCTAWTEATQRHLALNWGTETTHLNLPDNTDDTVNHAIDSMLKAKKVKVGDLIIVTAGVPAGKVGSTNLILVETIR